MRTRSGLSYINQYPHAPSRPKRAIQPLENTQPSSTRCAASILQSYFTLKKVAPRRRKGPIDAELKQYKNQSGFPPGVVAGFVFVGNVNPSSTEKDVHRHFTHCGRIRSVQISCGQGQGTTVGMPIPESIRGPQDSQTALIVFEERASVFKALKCHGQRMRKWPIHVSAQADKVAPGVPKPIAVRTPRKR